MKIVTSGGWSYGNIGDEVILTSTIYLLNKYFNDSEIIYTSYNPMEFNKLYKNEAVPSVHKIIEHSPITASNYREVLLDVEKYGLKDYSDMIDDDTVFIMSGGGYFVEEWTSQFVSRLLEIAIAKMKGAKVVLFGQSIGPINTNAGMAAAKEELDKCDFLAVRDIDSVALLNKIGIAHDINYVPDLAVVISDIIPKAHPVERMIGVMPAAYSSYTSIYSKKKNKYIEKLKKRFTRAGFMYKHEFKKIIKELSKSNSIRIILSTQWSWDVKFANYLAKGIEPDKITIVHTASADELCRQLSSVDTLVSTKMHPLIVASSYDVPTIGISYNFKVDNYMKMIGRKEYCTKIDELRAKNIIRLTDEKKSTEINQFKEAVYEMMRQVRCIGENE